MYDNFLCVVCLYYDFVTSILDLFEFTVFTTYLTFVSFIVCFVFGDFYPEIGRMKPCRLALN